MSQQIDDKNLQWAYWWNRKGDTVRRVTYGIAISIVGFIVVNAAIQTARLVMSLQATSVAHSTIQNARIETSQLTSIQLATVDQLGLLPGARTGSYDAFAVVQNPNRVYDIEFTYAFIVDGVRKSAQDTVVPASSDGYLVIRDFQGSSESKVEIEITDQTVELSNYDVTVDIQMNDIELRRLQTLQQTLDAAPIDERGTANLEQDFFVPEADSSDDIQLVDERFTSLSGTVVNASPVGFRTTPLIAVITDSNGAVLAVHKKVIKDLESFAEIEVQSIWERRFPVGAVGKFYVYPNVHDSSNVILPGQ